MGERVCAFTGHRSRKLPWGYDEQDARCVAFKKCLYDVVESLVESGVEHFISGMAQGGDLYFAEAVLALREKYPHITLEAAVPYPGQADSWPMEQRQRYERILSRCARVTVVQEQYSRSCMLERNRYMVDRCDVLLVGDNEQSGGTLYTINYARKKSREMILLPIPE